MIITKAKQALSFCSLFKFVKKPGVLLFSYSTFLWLVLI